MKLIQPIWNNIVREEQVKPTKSRSHIRSSEIGSPLVDRYYSMMGVTPTNPFDDRTLRIFDAGRVIEFITMRILAMSGILESQQVWVELQETDDRLKIVGYIDAIIGGVITWSDARYRIQKNLDDFRLTLDDDLLSRKARDLIDTLSIQFPNGLDRIALECKSINSQAFHKSKKLQDSEGNFIGYFHNKLQLYAYLMMSGISQGILLYVSKDDFSIAEVPVSRNDNTLSASFWDDIDKITYYYRNEIIPPKEQEIVYNSNNGKYELNWRVTRSPYLKLIYGYPTPDDMDRQHHQYLLDVNRAKKHLLENKVKTEDLEHISFWSMQPDDDDFND